MASPKIATLSDSFDGLALNAGLWVTSIPAGTGVILANGTLQIQITAGATQYANAATVNTYDLTGGSVSVQIASQGTPVNGFENWPITAQIDSNNATYAVLSGGFVGVYKKVAGVQTAVWFGAYDPVATQWARIRESNGTIYWEHSPDGSTWTSWTSLTNPFAVTDLQIQHMAGVWSALGFTETVNFDNLNNNPNYVPRDYTVGLPNRGSTPVIPTPQWDFLLYGPGPSGNPVDPSTWSQTSDLPGAKSRHIEVSLADSSSLSFSISGYHPDALLVQELATDVRVERNGTPVIRGRVAPSSDDIDEDNHTVSFTAYDYREMLKSKILYADYVISASTDVEAAVWSAINTAQTRTNGTIGITRGTANSSGVALGAQTVPAGGTLYDLADQFRTANGVEWDVDPGLVYRAYATQRGSTTNWLADLGGSVKKVTRTVDPNGFANAIRVTGSTSGISATAQTADVNNNLSPIGRWERQEGNLDYTTAAQATASANSWVTTDAQVIPGYDLTLFKGAWGGPTDLWVGDRIHVVVMSGRLAVDTLLRVVKIAIDVDEEGSETVVVSVGQLNPVDAFYKKNRSTYAAISQLSRR